MAARLAKSERRTVHVSMIVFALSMLLPAFQVWNGQPFSPGYKMAWLVENFFWRMSWESINIVFGAVPVPSSGRWGGWEILLTGAMANHLFYWPV